MAEKFFSFYPNAGPPGVTSLDGLTGALTLVAGDHITITPSGSTITIAATGELDATLTDSHIFVGNSSNVATDVPVSGDLTVTNTGVFSLVATSNSTLTTLSNLTSIGTISTGTWNGTVIDTAHGGTGTSTTFTEGSVVFAGPSGVYSEDNDNFFWDGTNHRLGVGTAGPTSTLHVTDIGSPDNPGSMAVFESNAFGEDENTYGIEIGKRFVDALFLGINRNSIFGSVPSESAYISTYMSAGTISIGRGDDFGGLGSSDIFIDSAGNVGIGTTAPSTQLHTTGGVRFANFGAGAATFDASGNISSVSDETLKNIQSNWTTGVSGLVDIQPIVYKWNEASGMETNNEYVGFSAQNVREFLPEASGSRTIYDKNNNAISTLYSIQDRAILATMINAIKELNERIKVLESNLK